MREATQIVCPGCGNLFHIPEELVQEPLSCTFCGKNIKILQHSSVRLQSVEAQAEGPSVNASAALSGHFGTVQATPSGVDADSGQQAAEEVSKDSSPPVPAESAEPAEPETAMLAAASTAFQTQGWPCTDWSGHKALAAQVRVASAKKGVDETINLTVFASSGVLCLETVVAPIPKPPLTPLREILHRINVRAGGSFFQIRDCGLAARYKLIPRLASGGSVTPDGVLRALKQLNQDRLNAAPLLFKENELRVHSVASHSIDHAFAAPLWAGVSSGVTGVQLRELAGQAEYAVNIKGAMLYIATEAKRPAVFPVWMSLSNQVVRGWTIPGSAAPGRNASVSWFRRIVGSVEPPPPKLSKSQFETLLKKLDELNESSGPLHYVWNGQQVLGMAIFPPTEKSMGVEDFKYLVEALLQRAREVMPELKGTPLESYAGA